MLYLVMFVSETWRNIYFNLNSKMRAATVAPFIDKYHPKTDDIRSVSIRVTYQRVKKYYATNIRIAPSAFEKIITSKRRSEAENEIYNQILSFQNKAISVIQKLPIFTFSKFEEIYFENRNATENVFDAFDKFIDELKVDGREGNASSCECAKRSIQSFKADLKFADVTVDFLRKYEKWMLANQKSTTTVGIYLRALRTIYNKAKIDKSLYPFGSGPNKYQIPTGKNIKKALTLEEIGKIYNYKVAKGSKMVEFAKDYWMYSYLCNGMNVKDICLLKNKNINGDIIIFKRAKTQRSKVNSQPITVSLKPRAKEIIRKWGTKSVSPESYVFPHLNKDMDAARVRRVIQQVTKNINKYMKKIAKELSIDKEVTTYFARHSFATVLRNSGVSAEFIGDALGHSDIKTTKNYFAGFEDDIIHKTTDALTNFI